MTVNFSLGIYGVYIMREQIYTAENKANHIIQLQDKLFHSPLKCIVHQYDQNDREIGIFDIEALYRCPNYRDYYYRIEPFLNTPRWKAIDSYFGLRVSNTGSNRFDIGIYHRRPIRPVWRICDGTLGMGASTESVSFYRCGVAVSADTAI